MIKRRKSIQNKLLFSFITFSISLSILLIACSYIISSRFVKQRMKEAISLTVDSLAASIDSDFKELQQLCDYLYVNDDLKEAIENDSPTSGDYFKLRSKAYQSIETYTFSHSRDNINYITILGENGYSLVYAINKADIYIDANMSFSYDSIIEENDFTSHHTVWGAIETDTFYPANKNTVEVTHIPLYRVLKNKNYSKDIGIICLSINPRLFYDRIEQYNISTYGEECSVLILDNKKQILNQEAHPLSTLEIHKIFTSVDSETRFCQPLNNSYVYYVKDISNDWTILCAIPETTLLKGNEYLTTLSLICFPICVMLCAFIHYYIFRRIFKPIRDYEKTLNQIANGQASLRIDINSDDEIGMLGTNINHMLNQIEALNTENLNNQLKLRDAFYQEKLAQINPHFLYNTLNSIRWMAMISQNMSIKRAIDSLWLISKYNMDSSNTYFVKLKDEIEIVKEYIYLQKLRYANKFSIEWNYSEHILDFPCPKLLLQPIIENAIVHGAYPTPDETMIIISCYMENDHLILNVYDDGCGMKEDVRIMLLNYQKGIFSKGSGFKNVLERLYYLYQDKFILDIQSQPEEYTNILIKLPVAHHLDDSDKL